VTPNQNVRPREVLEAIYGKIAKERNGLIRISRRGLFAFHENVENKEKNICHLIDPISLV
jgi:hypothetical protein